MDNSIIKRLRAENNTNPRDSLGWIFRQILISRSQRDQNRWKSVLSEHDKRCLAYVASGILSDEFRALLRIPGLWHQLPFGNMHKIQAMKCFEVSAANEAVMNSQADLDRTGVFTLPYSDSKYLHRFCSRKHAAARKYRQLHRRSIRREMPRAVQA